MSPRTRARALLGTSLALMLLGCWAGMVQWSTWLGLNEPEPLLRGLPAGGSRELVEPPTRVARRLVLVIADGLKAETARRLKAIDKLARAGIWGTARASGPTYSAPGYTTWLTGLDPVDSGVRTNRFGEAVPVDSLLARARAAGLSTLAYEDGKNPLQGLFGSYFTQRLGPPKTSWAQALVALKEADLSLIVLDGVDAAGHAHGGASEAYARAALALDAKVGQLAAAMDLARDLLVVVNDHGHLPEGGHGGIEEPVRGLFVAARGAGLSGKGLRGRLDARDLAPTLAVLLGLRPPAHNRGRIMAWALASDNEAGFLQGAFASQYLGRLRVERFLARRYGAQVEVGRGFGAEGLLRARVGNLAQARYLARRMIVRIQGAVTEARRRALGQCRLRRGLAYAVIWIIALGALLAARRRGWVRLGAVAWLLPLCTVLGGYAALRLLGLRPSLSFNGVSWLARFFAAGIFGALLHLLVLRLMTRGERGDHGATFAATFAGRVLSGVLVLGGLALAATALAPVAHDVLLPDLRLVASMFLVRLWFITFTLLAGLSMLALALAVRPKGQGAILGPPAP